MAGRIRLLVAAHAFLAVVQFAPFLSKALSLPLLWIPGAVMLGQMALLGLWLGLGMTRWPWRLAATIAGCAYLTAWSTAATVAREGVWGIARSSFAAMYAPLFGPWFLVMMVTAAVALAFRTRFEVRRQSEGSDRERAAPWRFSILGMLAAATLVAIVMSLVRTRPSARPPSVEYALVLTVLIIDVACAVWATLGSGRVGEKIAVTFFVAMMLSATESVSNQVFHHSLELFATQAAIFTIPTVVIVASLLVVRSCGYRLLPKSAAVP